MKIVLRLIITLVFISFTLVGQVSNTTPCDKIIKIDSVEYKKNKVKAKHLSKTKKYKKIKNKVSVQTKDTLLVFKDVFDNTGYREYQYAAIWEDTIRRWVIIEGWDDLTSLYYLVNLETSRVDTLFGEPLIFADKMVCLEGGYTDGGHRIQIWTINQNNITLNRSYDPAHKCDIYPIYQIYLNRNILYIDATDKDGKAIYLKLKTDITK